MKNFRRKTQNELDALSDEQMIVYIDEAREAEEMEAAREAVAVLAYGREPLVNSWVVKKVPYGDVEEVVAEVFASAAGSMFDGRSVGAFVNWLKVITARRIADYTAQKTARAAKETALPEEHEGEEDNFFSQMPSIGPEDGATEIRMVVAQVLERLDERNPVHAMVIRLNGPSELGFGHQSAGEAATAVEKTHPGSGMNAQNVHQIWNRFKRDVGRELGLEGF